MRFRELLVLRRREWIPILVAVLVNAIVGGWGIYHILGQINSDTMDTNVIETACRSVNVTKWISIPLLLFSVGSWLLRLNNWIKEPKET